MVEAVRNLLSKHTLPLTRATPRIASELARTIARHKLLAFLLLLAFPFRLGFGLCSQFWYIDEKQIYLTGLKFYATRGWPYFGPHITDQIQIPGALQGLVVGMPLFVLPIPEAPFILLNLLSFGSLCFLAWYCSRHLPNIPRWIIWFWLMTAPWTLDYSTHITNPSYILPGAILFFIAALETFPQISLRLIPLPAASFIMGLALFWVAQFHMSWVVLVPYALASFYLQWRIAGKRPWRLLLFFILGSVVTGCFLAPTFLKYGFKEGAGGTGGTILLNPTQSFLFHHFKLIDGILARFLSFASFEVPRFIGGNTAARLQFIRDEPWLIPFIAFLTIAGIMQPVAMIILWFSTRPSQKRWRPLKILILVTLIFLHAIFLFTFREPDAHTFYVTFPLVMLYSLYCWSPYLKKRSWQIFAGFVLISGVIFHTGLAWHNFSRISLYVNRSIPEAAIDSKNYHILGDRRKTSRY